MTGILHAAPSLATSAFASPMRMSLATNRQEAEALRPLWQEVQRRAGVVTLDADPDFYLGVYESLGERVSPYIAAFDTNALLVGRITTVALGSRIGYLNLPSPALRCLEVVYGGLVTDGSAEAASAILNHVRFVLNTRVADLIEVQHLDGDHFIIDDLCNSDVARLVTVEQQPHLTLDLIDSTKGERIQRHSSKTRNTFRREDKRLQAQFDGDLRFDVATREQEVEAFLRDADAINRECYHHGIDAGVRNDRRWRAIIGTLARIKALRGYRLMGGGRPIAYLLGAKHDCVCTLMATGYLPAYKSLSPGKVLLVRALDALADEQTHIVDFGWGEAEYKNVFTSQRRAHVTVRLFGNGLRARLAYAIDRAAAGTSKHLKSIAGGSRVQTWRRQWRERLQRARRSSEA